MQKIFATDIYIYLATPQVENPNPNPIYSNYVL